MFENCSEAIYEVMNSIHDALFIHDCDTGKILLVNKRMCEMYNCTYEQALTSDGNEFCLGKYPYSKNEAKQWLKKAKTEGDQIYEWLARKKTGEIFWTEIILRFSKIENKSYIIAAVRDISERKKVELQIKESEAHYRTIFENTGTATVIIEEDTIISLANSKFEEISGYSKNEIEYKKSWKDFVVKEDLERMLEQHMQRRIDNKTALKSYEFKFIDKSGTQKYILLTIDLIPNTKRSVASLQDITKRKKDEIELQESENRYRFLFEHNPVPMLIYECGTFNLLSVNEAFLKHYGYNNEQIALMKLPDLFYPEEQRKSIKEIAKRVRGHAYSGEWKNLKADGSVIDIQTTSHDITYENKEARITVINDITEQKKAIEELQKSRMLLRTTIDSIPMWVAAIDTEGNYFIANDYYTKTFHLPLDLIEQHNYKEFFPPELFEQQKALVDECIKKRKTIEFNSETEFEKGQTTYIYGNYTPLYDQAGKVFGVSGVAIDISNQKKAENEIIKLNQTLEERVNQRTAELEKTNVTLKTEVAEKIKAEELIKHQLEEKEILLKEIHHRVKNNMQVIISILNLQASFTKNEKIVNILKDSQSRISAMALVHEKLYQAKDFSNIDISEYITNLFKYLFTSYKSPSQQVKYFIDVDPFTIGIDNTISIGLITNELISNSFKYAFVDRVNCKIEVLLKKYDKQNLVLKIKDNGKGLPQGLDYKNTESLGLQLVYLLTEQIKGRLDVKSSYKGTSFYIIFPYK